MTDQDRPESEMSDIVDRAKAALELWDHTYNVSIEVHTGMYAAEDAYRNAPDMVSELVAEVKRLRKLIGQSHADGRSQKGEGRTPMTHQDVIGIVVDVLDTSNSRMVDQAEAILTALPAAGYAVVPLPSISFKGPNDTDASLLRGAAAKAEAGYPVGGSNVSRAVALILMAVADDAEARGE